MKKLILTFVLLLIVFIIFISVFDHDSEIHKNPHIPENYINDVERILFKIRLINNLVNIKNVVQQFHKN